MSTRRRNGLAVVDVDEALSESKSPDEEPAKPAEDPLTWGTVAADWLVASALYGEACDKVRLFSCSYCGAKADTADHVVARRWGGPDEVVNLVPVCRTCNSIKSDGDVVEFIARAHDRLGNARRRPSSLARLLDQERYVLDKMQSAKDDPA